jgi:hypothetical protein
MTRTVSENRRLFFAALLILAIPVLIISGWIYVGKGPNDGPSLNDAYADGHGRISIQIWNRNKALDVDMSGWTIEDGVNTMTLPAGLKLSHYVPRRSGSSVFLTERDMPFVPAPGAKLILKTPDGMLYSSCTVRLQTDPDYYRKP